ncbi:hypothetical protein BDF21DRAFT_487703 [Thamnidium elegans]|nr:hypothetical protein BDF21DRAFT_487703 [Thamnidium elegans]
MIATKKNRYKAKKKFQESDHIPLISFGDGMKNKDTVRIKCHTSGCTAVLYKELRQRLKRFRYVLVDINEFRTSKICVI